MKYREFEALFRGCPIFDLSAVMLLTGEKKSNVLNTLARWKKEGRLIALRRGMYTLPGAVVRPTPALVANEIYRPSYLSLEWALSYYGLIPEAVFSCTSVTPRGGRKFSNPLGEFYYRHIKPTVYWGFVQRTMGGFTIRIAEPEKALLDYWHLNSGVWTPERLEAMRLQQMETIDAVKLHHYSRRWNSPRLERAVETVMPFLE
jgi:predicted transcriptional regulator of viral defense system